MVSGSLSLGILGLAFVVMRTPSSSPKETRAPAQVVTPNALVSDQERWVHRLSQDQQALTQHLQKIEAQNSDLKAHNTLLEKRLEMMDTVLKGVTSPTAVTEERKPLDPEGSSFFPSVPTSLSPRVPSERPLSRATPQASPIQREGPRLVHLTRGGPETMLPKTVDSYVPAGTYVPGILTSGVVAPTSTEAQGNPLPILVRLVGKGTLPRGFPSDLKDAVVMGSCYGDLSSERALCRLHKLSLTERNGEIFESPVEGWILGEDGRPGLKGDVVDRAGKVAREALVAGILSGMAGFFQQQASQSSSPATLLTPQKSLEVPDLMKGGAARGASSALEKLADFSIRRAEQMQPVILIASGRRVDVVFKEGLDLSKTLTRQELKLVGQGARVKQAQDHARRTLSDSQKGSL